MYTPKKYREFPMWVAILSMFVWYAVWLGVVVLNATLIFAAM